MPAPCSAWLCIKLSPSMGWLGGPQPLSPHPVSLACLPAGCRFSIRYVDPYGYSRSGTYSMARGVAWNFKVHPSYYHYVNGVKYDAARTPNLRIC